MSNELDYLPHHLPNYHETDDPDIKAKIKERAVKQRLVKVPLTEVAEQAGVSIATVRKWQDDYARDVYGDLDHNAARGSDALVLDALERNAWTMLDELMSHPVRDIDLILKAQAHVAKLQEQRSKLMGYIAPQRVIHNAPVRAEYDAEIEAMVAALTAGSTGVGGALMSSPEEVYTREQASPQS